MAIETIIFDLDQTLIEDYTQNELAYATTCDIAHQTHGIDSQLLHQAARRQAYELWRGSSSFAYCRNIGISPSEGLWGDFSDELPEIKKLAAGIPEFRRQTWARALAEQNITDEELVAELVIHFARSRQRGQVVYPDVEPALRELQNQYKLALLTNGGPLMQGFKIKASGLAGYFDQITVSGDLGYGKPDRLIFQHTVDQLGVTPETAIMIGDNLQRDVQGAQNAGLRGIWLNRHNQPPRDDITPDAVITDLAGLADLL